MHSIIVTAPERDAALVWYGGSTFYVHDMLSGVISPAERTVTTHYGDDEANPPSAEDAVRYMLDTIADGGNPMWTRDDR